MNESRIKLFVNAVIRDYTHTAMKLSYKDEGFELKIDEISSICAGKLARFGKEEVDRVKQSENAPPTKKKKVEKEIEIEPEPKFPHGVRIPTVDHYIPMPDQAFDTSRFIIPKPSIHIAPKDKIILSPPPQIVAESPKEESIQFTPNQAKVEPFTMIQPKSKVDRTIPVKKRIAWTVSELQTMVDGKNNNLEWGEIQLQLPNRTLSSLASHWHTSIARGKVTLTESGYCINHAPDAWK